MPEMTPEVLEEAEAIRGTLNEHVAAVRNDPDLNEDARRRYLAKHYVRADKEMSALRESFEGTSASTALSLRRDLWGSASVAGVDAISLRDAEDRAKRLETPTEAHELLMSAEETGDKVLARAIAKQAYAQARDFYSDSEWGAVLSAYIETHPEVAGKLERLEAVTRQEMSTVGLFAFSLSKPQELTRFSATTLAELAG